MLRKILGSIVGVVVAFAAVIAGEMLLHQLFPAPMLDTVDPDAVRAAMIAAPLGAKLGLAVVYGVAALVGAFIAAWVARWIWGGWIPVGLLTAATVANFVMLPHPVWLVALCLVLIVLDGWLGARLGLARAVRRG